MEGLLLLLPFDKLEDCIVDTYYRQYGKLIIGFYITGDSIILKNTFDLDNKDNKRAKNDNDGEEEDGGKRDDGGIKDSDSRVEKQDSREKDNDKESDGDYSRFGHLGIPGKFSSLNTLDKLFSLDTLRKFPLLDTSRKLLDIIEDAMVISDGDKVLRLIATLA